MKCPVCGTELFTNYKKRKNSWKCPNLKCHRWFVGREIKEALPARKTGGYGREKNNRKEKMMVRKAEDQASSGWGEITPTKVNFETEGQELIGRIIEVQDTQLGVKSYSLLGEDSQMYSFLGTAVLDKCLSDKEGELVKIEYLGEDKTSKGFKVKLFKVFVWKGAGEAEPEEVPTD